MRTINQLVQEHDPMVTNTIDELFQSTKVSYIDKGKAWYYNANLKIKDIARNLQVDAKMVAETVAILSPFNLWENNLSDANRLLFSLKYERDQLESLTFTTFKSNVQKVIDMYDNGTDFEPTKTNMKTYAFSKNLMLDDKYVTLDRHMLRLIDFESIFGKTLTQKRYHEYGSSFFHVGAKYGLKAYELQAVLWERQRAES